MGKVLNVGCGESTYGTDFIDLYPSREGVIKLDVNKDAFPYPDQSFDEVYARQLVAHLYNPMNFFKESFRVLKKDGKLYVTTDNAGLRGWFSPIYHGGYDGKHGELDMCFSLHTPTTISNYAEMAGFKDVKAKYAFIIPFNQLTWKLKLMFVWYHFLSLVSKRFTPSIVLECKK